MINVFVVYLTLSSLFANVFGSPIELGDSLVGENVMTYKTGQIFPRSSTASCSTYASDWKSYCDTGDPFCDSGSNLNVHYDYTTKYGNAAASFVVSRL